MLRTLIGDSAYWEFLEPTKKYIVVDGGRVNRVITGVTEYKTSSAGLLIEVGRSYTPEYYYWRLYLDSNLSLEAPERIYLGIGNEFTGIIDGRFNLDFGSTGRKDVGYFPCDKEGGVIGTYQERGVWGLSMKTDYRKVKRINIIKNPNQNYVTLRVEFANND